MIFPQVSENRAKIKVIIYLPNQSQTAQDGSGSSDDESWSALVSSGGAS